MIHLSFDIVIDDVGWHCRRLGLWNYKRLDKLERNEKLDIMIKMKKHLLDYLKQQQKCIGNHKK